MLDCVLVVSRLPYGEAMYGVRCTLGYGHERMYPDGPMVSMCRAATAWSGMCYGMRIKQADAKTREMMRHTDGMLDAHFASLGRGRGDTLSGPDLGLIRRVRAILDPDGDDHGDNDPLADDDE